MMGPASPMFVPVRSSNCCSIFTCLAYFVGGVVGLALVECILFLYLLKKLLILKPIISPSSAFATEVESDDSSIIIQGFVWVAPLPDGDCSKAIIKTRKEKRKVKCGQRDGLRRGDSMRDVLEIAPVQRHAVLRRNTLFLRAANGTEEKISLEGMEVLTVSSSPGPSRKWGKKYPIKLYHPDHLIYRGCKNCLFYAQSGYDKEAWCAALRAMARVGTYSEELNLKMKREYREYTRAAEAHMPYLNKFYAVDGASNMDIKQKVETDGVSKRQMMWKKLARRASMGKDHKESKFSCCVDEIRRRNERSHEYDDKNWKEREISFYDTDRPGTSKSISRSGSWSIDNNDVSEDSDSTTFDRLLQGEAAVSNSEGEKSAPERIQKNHGESRDQVPAFQENVRKPKDERAGKEIDQGLLCLNMIVARLYFDFYHSPARLASVERLFQRMLMKIRTPSYIKSITIKEFALGTHPPFATAIRMLPADAGGALAWEFDLECQDGGFITFETRLDLREQSAQEKVASQLTEPGTEGDAAAAVLSGLKGDLEIARSASLSAAVSEARQDFSSSSRRGDEGSKKGRWLQSVKTMVSRVADQVSQVPLVLKIRLVSLKGTGILRLKAPPSDRMWFSFKDMPDIDLMPEPCIGEHRITSGPLGSFIANQLKIQIRESVVMPYGEDIFIKWMMAEKDNWLPLSTFPLPFFPSQSTDAIRRTSKQNFETQSNSSDEGSRPGHPTLPHSYSTPTFNGQNRPPRSQISHSHPQSALPGPSKSQMPTHGNHTDVNFHEPVITDAVHAFTSESRLQESLMSTNTDFNLTRPLLDRDSSEEDLRSIGEPGRALSGGVMDAGNKYYSLCSEGSATLSESNLLPREVANQDGAIDSTQTSRITRRARMLSMGKGYCPINWMRDAAVFLRCCVKGDQMQLRVLHTFKW